MKNIHHSSLEPGKTYYIQAIAPHQATKMVGLFIKYGTIPHGGDYMLALFDNFVEIIQYGKCGGRSVHLNKSWNFYEMKKYDIQRNMERRALDIVLRKIIGDENFTIHLL